MIHLHLGQNADAVSYWLVLAEQGAPCPEIAYMVSWPGPSPHEAQPEVHFDPSDLRQIAAWCEAAAGILDENAARNLEGR